jgi:retrograde regulation protein 2
VIDQIIVHFLRFRSICSGFNVASDHIYVLATEATRAALNSEEFRGAVKDQTGLEIRLLSKAEEGMFGAYGVASSQFDIEGLVMDLGGGSTQISWMNARSGHINVDVDKICSLPYGAAALTRLLSEAGEDKSARKQLFDQMVLDFKDAYGKIGAPAKVQKSGLTVYLSGGGWRRVGRVLLAAHRVSPYPIPIINGFIVSGKELGHLEKTMEDILASEASIFGVAKRKIRQVSAIAFLVSVIIKALPPFNQVRFCQGGIREGFLFDKLDIATRAQHPLVVATAPFSSPYAALGPDIPTTPIDNQSPINFLESALPQEQHHLIAHHILEATANLHMALSSIPSEGRPASALHSTSTGILASAHGLDHLDRAFLSLTLCERWGGKVAPTDSEFKTQMTTLLGPELAWWARYLGQLAKLLGQIHPAGVYTPLLVGPKAEYRGDVLRLDLQIARQAATPKSLLLECFEDIEAVGKKKNREGFGSKIVVTPTWS